MTKQERFEEFCRRLAASPPCATSSDAYEQLCRVLNEVEDELSGIPFNPDNWQTDGRMYPPQPDSVRELEEHPRVSRYRSRHHNTFIGENGSLEIRRTSGDVVFSKPGKDGQRVWEL